MSDTYVINKESTPTYSYSLQTNFVSEEYLETYVALQLAHELERHKHSECIIRDGVVIRNKQHTRNKWTVRRR